MERNRPRCPIGCAIISPILKIPLRDSSPSTVVPIHCSHFQKGMLSIPFSSFSLKPALDKFLSNRSPEIAFVKVNDDLHIVSPMAILSLYLSSTIGNIGLAPTSWKHLFHLASVIPQGPGLSPVFSDSLPSPLLVLPHLPNLVNNRGLQDLDLGLLFFFTLTLA